MHEQYEGKLAGHAKASKATRDRARAMIEDYQREHHGWMPPTAEYAGGDSERQGVGLPGHCWVCAVLGHIQAHPTLGCSDVGCYRSHDAQADLPPSRPIGERIRRALVDGGWNPRHFEVVGQKVRLSLELIDETREYINLLGAAGQLVNVLNRAGFVVSADGLVYEVDGRGPATTLAATDTVLVEDAAGGS
jgi:hypothetical protein